MIVAQEGRDFMTKVMVRNGDVGGALRVLKQQGIKDGSLKRIKEKETGYLKPGVKRRIAEKEGKKNASKRERMSRRDSYR